MEMLMCGSAGLLGWQVEIRDETDGTVRAIPQRSHPLPLFPGSSHAAIRQRVELACAGGGRMVRRIAAIGWAASVGVSVSPPTHHTRVHTHSGSNTRNCNLKHTHGRADTRTVTPATLLHPFCRAPATPPSSWRRSSRSSRCRDSCPLKVKRKCTRDAQPARTARLPLLGPA